MLMVISPAKTLDYDTPPTTRHFTQPNFLADSLELIENLRKKSPADIAELMHISDTLSVLNVGRYAEWQPPFDLSNAKQAVLAFMGDVYEGLNAGDLDHKELDYLQNHLRVLSGLYGLLRPLDLMQPYRLEMGTKLQNARGKNLYEFWHDKITETLNTILLENDEPVLVNLASDEYFKAVRPKKLSARVITPVFQDLKNGHYKIISFYAKRARGLMVRWAVKHQVTDVSQLKGFDYEGYTFTPEASDATHWVFRRDPESL